MVSGMRFSYFLWVIRRNGLAETINMLLDSHNSLNLILFLVWTSTVYNVSVRRQMHAAQDQLLFIIVFFQANLNLKRKV